MEKTTDSLISISRKWFLAFTMLAILASCLAVIVKGFHLFSSDRIEPFIQGADDAHYFMWLRSWVLDGDFDFANDIIETPFLEENAKQAIFREPLTSTGLVQNKFTVGWAVVSFPLYLVAHWVAPYTPWSQDGFSVPYQIGIWVQQMLIAALGFYLLWRILSRWVDRRTAATAILCTWMISPMIYYQTARISMVHNVVFVLGVLIVWLAIKIKEHLERRDIHKPYLLFLTLFTGFHAGLMVICRPSALVYLIMPIVIITAAMFPRWKRFPILLSSMLATAFVGAFMGVFPQLLAWKGLYGHWFYYSYKDEGFNWGDPQFYMSLFSAHHGLFNWHPMLIVGLGSLLVASIKGRFYRSWIFTLVLIIWVNSAWHMVYFGSAFGGRAYEYLVCFSMMGTAFLLQFLGRNPRLRSILLSVYALFAVWNILFMYAFMQGLVSREEPVLWKERIYAVIQIFS